MRRGVLLVLGMIVAGPAVAQESGWTRIGQAEWPYRPSVGEIVRTPGGVLLACPFGDGLYRSTDEGDGWAPVDIAENLPECALVVAEDGSLFAGTEGGVYRSNDDGITWTLAGLERRIFALAEGPNGRLWAIAREGQFDTALFGSPDGETWALVADEDSIGADYVGLFRYVSFSPEGDVFLGAQFGLFRSMDDGASWGEIEIDASRPGIVPSTGAVFSASGVAYLGATTWSREYGRGGYRSTDGGATWNVVTALGLFIETFALAGDGTVLAGTRDGLYGSADGLVWEPIGLNGSRHVVAAVLLNNGGETIILGTSRGIYRAKGTGWARVGEGFERGLHVFGVAADGEALYASANGELYWYDSAEDRWRQPANSTLPAPAGFRLVPYGGALLLSTSYGLLRTVDVGETWEALWVAEEEERIWTFNVTSSETFVLGTTVPDEYGGRVGRLYTSNDEGVTWAASTGWTSLPVEIVGTPSGTLLAVVAGIEFAPHRVLRSIDGGETWEERLAVQEVLFDLAVTPGGTPVIVGFDAHYRSIDDGLTWEQTASVGAEEVVSAPNGGLAAIRDPYFWYIRDVYYSVDEGQTWVQVSEELTAISLTTDAQSFIYVGTEGQGVFRSATPLAVSNEDGAEAPQTFALAPAYPNPFATSTRLPFSLPRAGSVTLTVHDVLGRRIATLVDATLPAGEHSATWNSGGAASGVYVVTLRAGSQVVRRRTTVAR